MRPTISIIMPVYNVERYISKSIESVLNQTFKDFELLIVDDGSPDNSVNIAEEYAQKDDRIRIFKKDNGGLSDARNYGFKYAKGEYIYFMDSDDYIEDELLEKSINSIKCSNAEVVLFGYHIDFVDDKEMVYATRKISHKSGVFSKMNLAEINVNDDFLHMMGYAWNKIYNKKFLDENNVSFEKGTSLIEDILFNEVVFTNIEKLVIIDDHLYHYIQRKRMTLGSTFYSNSYSLKMRAINARENILVKWRFEEDKIKKIIARLQLNTIRFCCSNMFYFKNNLSLLYKYKEIKKMINNPISKGRIINFTPVSTKDKVLKFLVIYKQYLLIMFLYNLSSLKIKKGE